jgi:exopolyphosphatase/guanosine-5'-triphosphate,3'-diphosphate pyrophosphatase
MLSIKKYAAIDIGSNAVRLLISNAIRQDNAPVNFKKSSLVRVPIRLGSDVFVEGAISAFNMSRMIDTMLAFKLLMQSHGVYAYKACATSAMREAKNGQDVVEIIFNQTGIKIDIIDGQEEAAIIAATDLKNYIDYNKTYLYVDVGGGSTEFSVIYKGKTVVSKSFKIGTVRLLNNMVTDTTWSTLEGWISEHTKDYDKVEVIGSGGNINKIFKDSGTPTGKPLTYFYLTAFYKKIKATTYDERIIKLNLNQDRADVIIPATRIYLSAMKWSKAQDIYVPKIGLSDGIIKSIYKETVSSSKL